MVMKYKNKLQFVYVVKAIDNADNRISTGEGMTGIWQ